MYIHNSCYIIAHALPADHFTCTSCRTTPIFTVPGEDTVPVSSVVHFVHLLHSYEYTEAYSLLYEHLYHVLKVPISHHTSGVVDAVSHHDCLSPT